MGIPIPVCKIILLNEYIWILTNLINFVPRDPLNNTPALVSDKGFVLNRWQAIISTKIAQCKTAYLAAVG